jgi:hypothetical protein
MEKRFGRLSLRLVTMASIGALVATSFSAPGIAAEPSGPSDCPDVLPVDQLTDGMLATGWTEVDSDTPQSFDVEVLGVLENGIAPGRDLIVVEVSGAVISQNGNGIWFGMSGSPVYHDGDLIGAVSYGLSFGSGRIGGLTPAEDMAGIPTDPDDEARIPLSRADRQRIAESSGISTQEVGDSFVQLKTPLSIGGASTRVRNKVAKAVKREELLLVPHAGGTTPSGDLETTDTPPTAGQSFAAALSYGDVTFTGVGTTTMLCDGRATAFGHPFFWTGDASWGAAKAEAITIVRDRTYGAYKLANIDATFGMVDQDRLAGIAATLGLIPDTVPIRSIMEDVNINSVREGSTLAVQSDFVPYITFAHLLSNFDVTIDRIGPGSSDVSWTLRGTREDGPDWTLSRENLYTSQGDIAYESLFEVENALYSILFNRFEDVELTSVDFDAVIRKEVQRYRLKKALVAKNGTFKDVRRISARPGDSFRVRALLVDEDGSQKRVTRRFVVPNRFRSGYVSVNGGGGGYGFFECFSEYGGCGGSSSSSFDKLLDKLGSKPTNDQLVMTFTTGRRRGQQKVIQQDKVVTGDDFIRVVRKRSGGEVSEGTGGGKG